MSAIDTDADLARGLRALLRADPRLRPVAKLAGPLPLRRRAGGFAGLAQIVTSQQLSTASAAAIFGRLAAAFDPLTPAALLAATPEQLMAVGLSRPKIRTLKAAAQACADGLVDFEHLAEAPADEAHRVLTAISGIGPWTTDIYLLFCVGHADAWPAGDLALQEAIRIAFALDARPNAKAMDTIAEPWRPWRGVAARLFWRYYAAVKNREGAPE